MPVDRQYGAKGPYMSVNVVTHLDFRGDARSALAFYQSVFGGEMAAVTYKEAGNVQDSSDADAVVWGQVTADSGFRVMAYDVPARLPWSQGENAFFVSLGGETADEVTAYWERLTDGATVLQPLGPAQWSALHGMLKDRFGVTWIVGLAS
jgi:PhnB protein